MRQRLTSVLIIVGLAGLLPASPLLAQVAEAEKPAGAAAPAQQRPVIELLDAGKEPRRKLVYNFGSGARQVTTILMDMSIKMDMDDAGEHEQDVPAMRMVMDVDASPKGEHYEVRGTLTKAGTPDTDDAMMVELVDEMLGGMVGLVTITVMDERGVVIDSRTEFPDGLDPALQQNLGGINQSIMNSSIHLPGVDAGVGARWKVTLPVESQGMKMTQVAEYEVISIDGDIIEIRTSVRQSAERQRIDSDTTPGIELELVSMDSEASGITILDLRRPVPLRAEATTSMKMHIRTVPDDPEPPVPGLPPRKDDAEPAFEMKQQMKMQLKVEAHDRD